MAVREKPDPMTMKMVIVFLKAVACECMEVETSFSTRVGPWGQHILGSCIMRCQ